MFGVARVYESLKSSVLCCQHHSELSSAQMHAHSACAFAVQFDYELLQAKELGFCIAPSMSTRAIGGVVSLLG